jgi:hypothetical protein
MTNDWQTGTKLLELDLANPAAPALARSASVSGGLRTSRVVGDVLYAVTDSGVQSFLLAPSPLEPADTLAIDGGAEFAHANDAYILSRHLTRARKPPRARMSRSSISQTRPAV